MFELLKKRDTIGIDKWNKKQEANLKTRTAIEGELVRRGARKAPKMRPLKRFPDPFLQQLTPEVRIGPSGVQVGADSIQTGPRPPFVTKGDFIQTGKPGFRLPSPSPEPIVVDAIDLPTMMNVDLEATLSQFQDRNAAINEAMKATMGKFVVSPEDEAAMQFIGKHRTQPGMQEKLESLIINIKRRKVNAYLQAKLQKSQKGTAQQAQPKPPPSGVAPQIQASPALSVNDFLRAFEA